MVVRCYQVPPRMGRKFMEPLEVLVKAVDSAAMFAADDDIVGRQVGQHSWIGVYPLGSYTR